MTTDAATEPAGAPLRRGSRLGWSLAALALSLVHFLSFDALAKPVLTDVRYFLYFAWRVAEGEAPHLDLFDPKTQLATMAGALLFRLGSALGVEELYAIRFGYLGFAALGAWLAFFLHRRLAKGSGAAGFAGALAVTAFGILGELPALGNVPKLLMSVCATGALVAIGGRRWVLAGALGSLAFLDWQIGAVVWVAAFVAALAFGADEESGSRPGRTRRGAAGRVVLGGALGLLPFVLYLAAKGALVESVDQAIASAFFRGSVEADSWTLAEGLRLFFAASTGAAQSQAWLFWVSFGGVGVAIRRVVRPRGSGDRLVLVPALVLYAGVLGFNVIDLQARGDAFVVLHAMAFFLGLLAAEVVRGLEAWRPRWGALVALLVLALGARPASLRPDYVASWTKRTLDDQRELARILEKKVEGRTLAVVERCEYLFLLRRVNPLPFVYWNSASWGHYRVSPDESGPDTLRRFLASSGADAMIVNPFPQSPDRFLDYGIADPGPGWNAQLLSTRSGKAQLLLHTR